MARVRTRNVRSSDSEVMGHLEGHAIASHRPATLCRHHDPTVFLTVVFVIFKFEQIIARKCGFVKGFCKKCQNFLLYFWYCLR